MLPAIRLTGDLPRMDYSAVAGAGLAGALPPNPCRGAGDGEQGGKKGDPAAGRGDGIVEAENHLVFARGHDNRLPDIVGPEQRPLLAVHVGTPEGVVVLGDHEQSPPAGR